ncbi:hydroxylase [Apibacter raozihei]|uniref:hydroxylase n=1 Tax=Apibacter raozihei TaxID=2500547 RepID=UPI000FE2DD89|nr:hydroxylase [Apibacter raozihei]
MGILSAEVLGKLKEEAVNAEKIRKLTDSQLEIIYSQNLFNLFVPKYLGGLELNLLEGLQLQEVIAKLDGSLGWTVTLCSGANAFVGYLSGKLAENIFKDPKVCFGGSGKIGGVAEESQDGYLINGKWSYVTGIPHVNVFTANCQIKKNGKMLTCDKGTPIYKSFIFFPEEVKIIEDWNTIGLIATASHSYTVENLFVKKERSFLIKAECRSIDLLIYKYPFLTFAELTLAVNHLGMQKHFFDLVETIFNSIQEPLHKEFRTQFLKNANHNFQERRALFYKYVEDSWNELEKTENVSHELLSKISIICREIVKEGRETALQLYPYLGILASNPITEINRILRDILTASQHSLLL